ncbi:MAG: TIGR00730 family Rossman fold protein [Pseudomonadales bacterium]
MIEKQKIARRHFPSARDDAGSATLFRHSPQTESQSYRLAYTDDDFMVRDELRAVRLQLELLKPELVQQEHKINSTVVVFGSARIPDLELADKQLREAEAACDENGIEDTDTRLIRARRLAKKVHYYDQARQLAERITRESQKDETCELVVVTGGGGGVMEAANRGANDAGGKSIGLNIVLPMEQCPNPYITPELTFQFHYFAIRKMHFLLRAKALIAFPGGFGTMDELFEALTLVQTGKIEPLPILLFGREYWERIINFDALMEEGMISPKDLELFHFVDTPEQAWVHLAGLYDHCDI